MEKAEIIRRAIANGEVYNGIVNYISVREVVMKIVDCTKESMHMGKKIDGKNLLKAMAEGSWKVIEGLHRTDANYKKAKPDEEPHIRVEIRKAQYHLRVDSREHIYYITGPEDCGIPPYLSPGSHSVRKRRFRDPFGENE